MRDATILEFQRMLEYGYPHGTEDKIVYDFKKSVENQLDSDKTGDAGC